MNSVRLGIAIPTYNNPATIACVVQGCLSVCEFPIIVVDDGSTVPVTKLLEVALKEHPERLHVVRLLKNSGKGIALQTGFAEAAKSGMTHVLTIDGDGQHPTCEIPKLIAACELHPNSLVIGCRRLNQIEAPSVSKFGRRFSNFWVWYQTDQLISDSQSGLRIYPLLPATVLHYFTRRFDFELEILVRLLWKKVPHREVWVDVNYPKDRVSHFDKFHDNVRITTMNVLLIILSLFRLHWSPRKILLATSFGLLAGMSASAAWLFLLLCLGSFFGRLNGWVLLLAGYGSLWMFHQDSFPISSFLAVVSLIVFFAWHLWEKHWQRPLSESF